MANSMARTEDDDAGIGSETVKFVLHKAKGIFPYYLAAWLISFAITSWVTKQSANDILHTALLSPYNLFMVEMAGNYDMGHRVQGSWYISAMMISIFALYPVRRKYTNFFDCYIAPIFFLFFIGYTYQRGKGTSIFTVGYDSNLYMYNGLVRAIVEISIGCSCFRIVQRIKTISFSRGWSVFLSLIEFGGYALIIYCANKYAESSLDLTLLFIICLCVIVSFSEKGYISFLRHNRLCSFLGEFSLYLYLSHEVIKNRLLRYFEIGINSSYYLPIYFFSTMLCAIICMYGGRMIASVWNRIKPA